MSDVLRSQAGSGTGIVPSPGQAPRAYRYRSDRVSPFLNGSSGPPEKALPETSSSPPLNDQCDSRGEAVAAEESFGDNLRHFYPEVDAGGFTRVDGTVAFYVRVNALLRPDMVVLDYGAGRGAQLQNRESPFRTALATLKGKVGKVIGADVDRTVLENPFLDEAHVIDANGGLPFSDRSIDLIVSDWVLEHVEQPERFASEALRVLRPGGWLCARTPNRWGMTGLATNIVPNSWHAKLLRWLQPGRAGCDIFPTEYKLNSRAQIGSHFPASAWEDYCYFYNPEPPYVQRSRLLMRIAGLLFRLAPESMANDMHVFLRKR